MSRIEGRVAQIMTEHELVINRGSEHGVEIGMRFKILRPRGSDIRDPDTGEVIGSVELMKTVVKVIEVQEKLCVARTFRTIETKGGSLYPSLSMASMLAAPTRRIETLRTDETRVQQDLDAADSYVKIGDPAVQAYDPEAQD
ncbi:hypothetical protein [Arthrobacter ramosus]|uniref:Uncharacterized protein n=1 Tax=Arthrobacter ramosus TaxID=1672 RepID=A0ABV5XVR3_ARTRM|nr:hypothetical protein [Arthrobacter ramosus]